MQLTTKSVSIARLQWLAFLSCLGVVLYVVIDIILFFLRPDLPIFTHAESDYGNGPWSWLMDINFLLRCALSLAALLAFWTIVLARLWHEQSLVIGWIIAAVGLFLLGRQRGSLYGLDERICRSNCS